MKNVKIVADSSADTFVLDGIAYESVPLKINTAEREYIDDESLDLKQMVDDLSAYHGKSSTSCPNSTEWLNSFGDAENIFVVTITASLSGSYNAACLAKKQYEEAHPDSRVYVINSLSTGPEMRLITEKLCELISEGLEFDEVCEKIEKYMKKTGLLFVLQSMKNLANNGRVSQVAAKMAGILGIRALGKASDRGDLEMLEKCRGEKRTLESIVSQLKALGYNSGRLRIAHCFNEGAAAALKEKVLAAYKSAEIAVHSCRGLCSFYAETGGLLIGFEKV